MPYTPLTNPAFARGPVAFAAASITTAKTTLNDLAGAVQLVPAHADRRRTFGNIYGQAVITTVAGKILLLISDGTNHRVIDEVLLAAGTITTTANPVGKIEFPKWTPTNPLVLMEGESLHFGITTTQTTAGAVIMHAAVGKEFGQ